MCGLNEEQAGVSEQWREEEGGKSSKGERGRESVLFDFCVVGREPYINDVHNFLRMIVPCSLANPQWASHPSS